MPSLIDPREGKIPILPNLAAYTYSAEDMHIACCLKFLRHGIVNGCRDYLATDPITRKVSVSIYECYLDTAVEEIADSIDTVWAEKITGTLECFADHNAIRAVIHRYA